MASVEPSTKQSGTELEFAHMSMIGDNACNNDSDAKETLAMDVATGTKTPQNRLNIQVSNDDHVQSSPPTTRTRRCHTEKALANTPMSTCSTATHTTTTSTTTDGTTSFLNFLNDHRRSNFDCGPLSSSSSRQSTPTLSQSCASIRGIPLPSPSRSRLDRQYAKRLAASSVFYQSVPTAKSPVSVLPSALSLPSSSPSPSPSSATATAANSFHVSSNQNNSAKIKPPPGIARNIDCVANIIFRPKSILSPTDESHGTGRSPGRFLFPPSPRLEKRSGNQNTNFLSSNNSISQYSAASSTSSGNNSNSNSNSTTLSSSRRRRNSRVANSMDVGISDRFIPSRATSNLNNINLWDFMQSNSSSNYGSLPSSPSRRSRADNDGVPHGDGGANTNNTGAGAGSDESSNTAGGSVNPATGRVNETSSITTQQNLHNVLLRSELLGENISPYSYNAANSSQQGGGGSGSSRQSGGSAPLRDGINRLRFQSPRQAYRDTIYDGAMGPTSVVNSFSLTPFGNPSSQQLMAAPQKHRRKIAKVPFKVLDAPALQDDFYLNLVDWSTQNVLAVGLGHCVYLWSACTSKVTKLCDLQESEDHVTSVSWAQRGTHLAVGTNKGEVQLWDTIKEKKVRTMSGHSARVGTLAWSGPTLASGSRDRTIFLRDVREKSAFTNRLNAHRQEVCGLKWSFDEPAFLASGGNDNQLHVVDSRNPTSPVHRFTDHTAAVKAIAWSPHQHGLLASGGGTADRCIRFWNTLSGSALNCVDTGSQVCNLAWSQNCNEIVSTHGYSLNQIVVWRYPSLSKVVTLTGHTYRVLYLAMSPDGSTIVTGAGDETLRFWQVFPGPRSDVKNNAGGLLFPNTLGSVIR
eukprot:CAMPEP_0172361334 /NCGR_PEP_ID=MMETSP1060-20121228/5184_1 /TAXON_ID=37318 /ORGANISM="Pseudo-nitzschia pungens, Strain cf. cingulata" /LENGTH=858 /DNA_ID=CAMNT_0013083563 /DNA_START=509 /DNA_END=3088 /DNA_ORIENTATION=-